MRKPALLLAYVVVLAAFAGVAWHFRSQTDPDIGQADTWKQLAAAGLDVPEHLYPEDAYVDELTQAGQRLKRYRGDFSAFKDILNDANVLLYNISDTPVGAGVVGLKRAGSGYAIFHASGGGATPDCEKPVDAGLGKRIASAWEKVLLETRPTTRIPYSGPDGSFEHFGLVSRFGVITGKMWSPPKPFRPGWLRQAAWNMQSLCAGNSAEAAAELEAALRAIEVAN